jgi:hypothetical protein
MNVLSGDFCYPMYYLRRRVSHYNSQPARRQSAECINGMLSLFSLYDDRHASVSGYSNGMRQKALIAYPFNGVAYASQFSVPEREPIQSLRPLMALPTLEETLLATLRGGEHAVNCKTDS